MLKNHVLGSFNLNNSQKYRLSFETPQGRSQDLAGRRAKNFFSDLEILRHAAHGKAMHALC